MREGHKYNASDFEYLDSLGYEFDDAAMDCRADKDLNRQAPICIGMDYNANINWLVAGQPLGRKNKNDEKNPETEENLLEHCTDGTDDF